MTRTRKLLATALLGCSVVLTAAACGTENEAASGPNSASATAVTPPANSSIPVVGGPKPKTTNSDSAPPHTNHDGGDQTCGATKGPDGALQIHLIDGELTCDTAKTIAKEYGPLIATGAPQTVSGWDCGPSTVVGELARCTKGTQTFSLMPN